MMVDREPQAFIEATDGWIDVTMTIQDTMVVWPDQPLTRVMIDRISHLNDEDGTPNVSKLTMSLHTGTHLDAPVHFIKDGADITTVPLKALVGQARVAHIGDNIITRETLEDYESRTGRLMEDDRLIFRTRNSDNDWSTLPFRQDYVAVDAEAASYLASRRVLTVGIDYLSIAPFSAPAPTHKILLAAKIWIIEGLDLREISEGLYSMLALPLKIKSADASPLRVFMRETQDR